LSHQWSEWLVVSGTRKHISSLEESLTRLCAINIAAASPRAHLAQTDPILMISLRMAKNIEFQTAGSICINPLAAFSRDHDV